MFGTIKNEEQMEKLYKKINEHYKTINRDLVNDIVNRIDEITDMYFDYCFPDMNDKEKKQNENALLTKRILRNEKLPEPSTFDTILNFICAVFHFIHAYDNEPHKLFHHCNIYDWMICAVRKCDMKYKFMFMYNDQTIPSTMERFFNITNQEIHRLLNLNFPTST